MTNQLLALIAKYQLRIQWEDPDDVADELLEPEDKDPCTLVVTSVAGTVWSVDYENTEEGRTLALQQLLLEAEAEGIFVGDEVQSSDENSTDGDPEDEQELLLEEGDEDDEDEGKD